MKLLLDSHTLIWAVDEPTKLGTNAKLQIEKAANEIFVSAATLWEIAIKVGLGKLTLSSPYQDWMQNAVTALSASTLPITIEFAAAQAQLPYHHRDPFDGLLAAQAIVADLRLVSQEALLDQYGVNRLW